MPIMWLCMLEIQVYLPGYQIKVFVITESVPETRTGSLESDPRFLNSRQICIENITIVAENQGQYANNLVQYE